MIKEKNKKDYLYEGLILVGISATLLLILFGVFKSSGKVVSNFLLGTFGYALFAYSITMLTIGVLRLFQFEPKVAKLKLIGLILSVFSFILIFHVVTSKALMPSSYGKYLKLCYETASTGGGILFGVLVYPFVRLNYYFALVLSVLLFMASLFIAFFVEINKSVNFKMRETKIKHGKNGSTFVDLSKVDKGIGDVQVGGDMYVETLDKNFKNEKVNRSTLNKQEQYMSLEELGEIRQKEQNDFLKEEKQTTKTPQEIAVDFLYKKNTNAEKVVDDIVVDEEEFKRRAVELLYSKDPKITTKLKTTAPSQPIAEVKDTVINESKPKIEGDFSSYTNNYRLNQIRENMLKNSPQKENLSSNINQNEYDDEKAKNFNNFIEPIIEPKEFQKTNNINANSIDDIQDLSAKNSGPLDSFEDMFRRKRMNKEKEEEIRKLKEHLGEDNAELIEKMKKERSDKGGTHFGAGVNFTKIPATPEVLPTSSSEVSEFTSTNKQQKVEDKKREQIVESVKPPVLRKVSPYKAPPIALLRDYVSSPPENEDFAKKIASLENTLASFNINAKVMNVITGPTFTRLELQMPVGIPVNRIAGLSNDISMCLEAKSVRCQIPIPGKNCFGVEIPNKTRGTVGLKSLINSANFNNNKQAISFAVGSDCDGLSYVIDLTKMPHLLIAGATGAGKSVCINTLICSILYKYSPEEVKLLLVDPKQVELSMYNGLPHMLVEKAIFDKNKVLNLLDWAIDEMESRYTLFSAKRVKNLAEFNENVNIKEESKLPYIVIIIDEVADIVCDLKKDFEERIKKLAAKARAAGIVMVLATQRPSVDVITGTIKANLPSRIAFAVSSYVDSKTIIDTVGAEKLLRNGDMLFADSNASEPVRIQGAFVSNGELDAVCQYIIENNECYFDPEIEETISEDKNAKTNLGSVGSSAATDNGEVDILMIKGLYYFIETGIASISKLQRRFGLGFPRAARLVDKMEDLGFVGALKDNKTRDVLIDMPKFMSIYGDVEIE